jgi:archaellum component FlaG (FlaF/FlaG flagellin family)
MKRILLAVALFFSVAVQSREFVDPINSQSNQIARVSNTNTTITVKFKNPEHVKLASNNYRLHFIVNGNDQIVAFDKKGEGTVTCIFKNTNKLSVLFEDVSYQMQLPVISIWYMILPLGGLLLFLMYKIAFAKKNMTLSKRDITEKIIDTASKSNLKVVSRREEEVLV